MKRLFLIVLLGLATLVPAIAARITTRDGSVINGDILTLRDGIYKIRTTYGTVDVPATSVIAIDTDGTDAGRSKQADGGVLRMAGSTTIGDELMPALIELYAAKNGLTQTHWTIEGDPSEQMFNATGPTGERFAAHLSRHGSATAFTALATGAANVGMASRPVNKDEVQKLAAAAFGEADAPGQEHVLALDGLIVLVNKANPVDHVSLADLAAIFSGATTDWSRVGGTAGPIHVLGRDAKSGTADTFNGIVMKGKKIVAGAELMDTSDGLSDKVAGDPAAIGFAGFAYTRRAKALEIVSDCGLQIPATDFFVRTEEYPLARRLFLYTRKLGADDETSQRFLALALSRAGQDEAARKGFVDLTPRLSAPGYSASRIATALGQVAEFGDDTSADLKSIDVFNKIATGGQRMSATFRFRTASFDLDTRAVRDLERVVAALRSSEVGNRAVTLIGFSDAQGSAARNLRLSQARAERIATLLKAKGIVPKAVIGLGRAAPVACNSSPEGLEKNRRVEIWVGKASR